MKAQAKTNPFSSESVKFSWNTRAVVVFTTAAHHHCMIVTTLCFIVLICQQLYTHSVGGFSFSLHLNVYVPNSVCLFAAKLKTFFSLDSLWQIEGRTKKNGTNHASTSGYKKHIFDIMHTLFHFHHLTHTDKCLEKRNTDLKTMKKMKRRRGR